ncbi:hypothetical protein M2352_002113 [Azospirillum fermentarium]|uniref:hypothetical protein n=1 Tax=Azospirillum fermentarium TaxID=1233114 RepID=UPI0022264860|nr:hypothetical protein [Azospirillum fermentarium]MCW2246522.1 hypothetical protein [Azospirillum fermentarium]
MITTAVPSPQPCRPSGRRGLRAGLLAAAVLVLTACPGATVPTPPPPARVAAPPTAAARPKIVPAPPRSPIAPAAISVPDTAPGGTPAPAAPLSLVGISQQEARALLGAPTATTEEASAIVWDYGGRECGLRLFFFMDVNAHDFRTLSFETTDAGSGGGDSAQCLARLAAQKGN